MSELRQALELAIKALENSTPRPREGDDDYAEQGFCEHFAALSVLQDELTKLKASLPDPVAWVCEGCSYDEKHSLDYQQDEINAIPIGTLLYTHPPQREWQGLTDYEINNFDLPESGTVTIREFVRIIEAKLKEKNT